MSSSDYLIEKFVLLLYSKIFSANTSIQLDDFGLKAHVKFKFDFTDYPKDIKVFIPRRYDREKDYFSVGVPLLHKPYEYSKLTQSTIKNKMDEYSGFFEGSFTRKDYVPYIFELLEKWLIFNFLHFIFEFTGIMRNEKTPIQSFESTSSAQFWDIIKPFLFPFWFIKFFSKNFAKIIQFLENIKEFNNYSSIIQDLTKKMPLNDKTFDKFTGLYPLWFDDDNYYICKFLEEEEINRIFFGFLKPPLWFDNLSDTLQKKGLKFNIDKTRWLNNIEEEKISKGQYVCFYFCSKLY